MRFGGAAGPPMDRGRESKREFERGLVTFFRAGHAHVESWTCRF
jgi:hypothetical protein